MASIGGREAVSHEIFTFFRFTGLRGLSSISSDTIKSLDVPEGVLLSGGEELGEVDAKSFIYRLIKVIIDIQG